MKTEDKSIKKRLLNEDSFSDFYSNPKTSTYTTNVIKHEVSDTENTCRSSVTGTVETKGVLRQLFLSLLNCSSAHINGRAVSR